MSQKKGAKGPAERSVGKKATTEGGRAALHYARSLKRGMGLR
jgi:hypothetical protein